MGTYIHFTDEQKERANSVDLEELHGLLIGCPVVVLDEADRVAAPPGNMVVPFVAPDSNMMDPGQPGLPPSAEQLLPPPPQDVYKRQPLTRTRSLAPT